MTSPGNTQKKKLNILILGASYGSLLSTKILMAGHDVTLICRESTAAIFNAEGSIVRTPVKGSDELVEIRSKDLSGKLTACTPESILDRLDSSFDLAVLAMQEPQYSSPGVRDLVIRIADTKLPTMAITNMPLIPYLRRIPKVSSIDADYSSEIACCFSEPTTLWSHFDPNLLTQCSPDPQAFRPNADTQPNLLQVRLPTNFKAARFASNQHTAILRRLEHDIEAARLFVGSSDSPLQIPVKLRVHDSLFVPLAKWAMLMAGNYRCIQPYPNDMISICEAVTCDLDASRAVYDWVVQLCVDLGGNAEADFVPFEKYAAAAKSLASPSSAARALASGATHIERVDKVVLLLAKQQGKELKAVTNICAAVDEWLAQNEKKKKQQEDTISKK